MQMVCMKAVECGPGSDSESGTQNCWVLYPALEGEYYIVVRAGMCGVKIPGFTCGSVILGIPARICSVALGKS